MGPATAAVVEGFSVDSLEDPDHLHSNRTTVKRRGACHGVCCKSTHSSGLDDARAAAAGTPTMGTPRRCTRRTIRALRPQRCGRVLQEDDRGDGAAWGMRGEMEGSGSAVRACARLDGTASCKRAMGGLACSACVRHTPARPALRLSRSKTTASVVRVTTAFERRSSRTPTQRWTCRDLNLAHSHRSRRWRASQ